MAKNLSNNGIVLNQTIYPQHVSQSVDAFTGADDYDITVSGSFTVTGSTAIQGDVNIDGSTTMYGNVVAPNLTSTAQTNVVTFNPINGQLYYTASSAISPATASNAVSASYALTSSYAVSASYALTASYVKNAQTASYVETAQTASFITASGVFGPYGSNSVISSSYAVSASYSVTASYAVSSSYALSSSYAVSASYAVSSSAANNAISASYSTTASFAQNATSASYAVSASHADLADTASYVTLAQTASYVTLAQTASYVTLAQTASYVLNAVSASYAVTSSYSNTSISASYALTASYLEGYISPFPFTGSAQITGSLGVTGSATINGDLVVNGTASFNVFHTIYNSSSIIYASGSTKFGDTSDDTHQFTGSLFVSGSITADSFTGTASYATQAATASYVLNAVSASYAATASISERTTQTDIFAMNQSGFTIEKGMVVRITGSNNSSDIPRITTASYETDGVSANTLGIATQQITNGSQGFIITEGVLTGIDTSLYISGQLLYLGANGSITGTEPQAPLHTVRLGQVIRQQSNNGSMHVRIDNGYEIGELHDIIDNTTTTSYGDLLVKSGSVWINSKQLTGSYGVTGSISATSFTGSLFGTASTASFVTLAQTASYVANAQTASYVLNAVSASYVANAQTASFVTLAQTASFITASGVFGPYGSNSVISSSYALTASYLTGYVSPFPYTGSAQITGSLGLTGSLNVYKSGSNVVTISGSTGPLVTVTDSISGPLLTVATGSTNILVVDSSLVTTITGSLNVQSGVTASLFGTASWALNTITASYIVQAVSASYAATASYVVLAQTASYVANAQTASYVLNAVSSSFATTASYATTASFVANAQTASFVTTAQTASYVLNAVSASFASTASYVNQLNQAVLISGSLNATGSVNLYRSGSSPLIVSGSNGPLFEVTDTVSGSLWTIYTGSLPIFDLTSARILTLSGSAIITGSLNVQNGITGSLFGTATTASFVTLAQTASFVTTAQTASFVTLAQTASYVLNAVSSSFAATASYVNQLNQAVLISGSLNATGSVNVYKSGSIVLAVSGSNGPLFDIADVVSGSLFTVWTGSNRILQANSDYTTILGGASNAAALFATNKTTANSGSTTIYNVPTASYDSIHVDYNIRSGSVGRAGNLLAMWSGSNVNQIETSASSFGDTSGFTFGALVSGSNLALTGSTTTNGWTVKTIIRSI